MPETFFTNLLIKKNILCIKKIDMFQNGTGKKYKKDYIFFKILFFKQNFKNDTYW